MAHHYICVWVPICVWAVRMHMGQPIPVWVPIHVWAIPYMYGTAHTCMDKNMHMVWNTDKETRCALATGQPAPGLKNRVTSG